MNFSVKALEGVKKKLGRGNLNIQYNLLIIIT